MCIRDSLNTDVANVAHAVLSVDRLNSRGMSTWMPASQMEHAWLLTDDGRWHELSGPCLLGQH
eukprot:12766105-Alexandrium_andersonii.AAC.1